MRAPYIIDALPLDGITAEATSMNYAYIQTKELRAWCDKHNLESFTWSKIKSSKIVESPGQLHRLAVRGYIKRLGETQIGKKVCDKQVEYTFI